MLSLTLCTFLALSGPQNLRILNPHNNVTGSVADPYVVSCTFSSLDLGTRMNQKSWFCIRDMQKIFWVIILDLSMNYLGWKCLYLFIPVPTFFPSLIPDPTCLHPGSTWKNLTIWSQKNDVEALENSIRVVHPGSRCWLSTHPGPRFQGSNRHRIPDPDPQHCTCLWITDWYPTLFFVLLEGSGFRVWSGSGRTKTWGYGSYVSGTLIYMSSKDGQLKEWHRIS
jgi:hypothetical protein